MIDDTTTTEASAASPDGSADDAAAPAPARERRRPRWSVLPWLVAAVAVLVAIATTTQWLALRAQEQTREDVQRAAEEFVVELTTWDASDGLDDTREALEDAGTGTFLVELEDLFGGEVRAEAEELEAVSTGDVQDVFVQRIREDEAIAFAVVVQEIRSKLADVPEQTVRSVRLTLVREEDRWLVSSVDVLRVDPGQDDEEEPSP